MYCTDGMLWIGQSYSEIFCKSKESCAIPFKQFPPHCFVHEAEWRGCCRKVSRVPSWAIPGKTRIFLVHKDNLKNKEYGRIFGYYILEQIEIITPTDRLLTMPLQNVKEKQSDDGIVHIGEGWDGSRVISHRRVNDKWLTTDENWPELPPESECKDGDKCEKECPDGTRIVTHKCENGRWIATREECPEGEPEECIDGDVRRKTWPSGSLITHICKNGKWEPTGAKCPRPTRPYTTMFEPERSCSLRLKPGSIYLVDALTAEITDHFDKQLEKERILEKYLKAKNNLEREKVIKESHKKFRRTVDNIHKKRKERSILPLYLEGKAELHGELILFKRPPIFERCPTASFRGLLRIDGQKLLEQIGQGIARPKIYYCDKSLESQISTDLKITKALAGNVIKKFFDIVTSDLKNSGSYKFPGFGKFEIVQRSARMGRNPNTGEIIQIPAKKAVRFRAYKKLKEEVERS